MIQCQLDGYPIYCGWILQRIVVLSCQKTKYQLNACILRVSKFWENLWISYFLDDITTIFGPEKTLISWRYQQFWKGGFFAEEQITQI